MRAVVSLSIFIAVVSAHSTALPPVQRITGGSTTTIAQYPSAASLLYSKSGASFYQSCAGTILNTQNILSAAHCFVGDPVSKWRVRVGSTYANSGGVVHNVGNILFNGNATMNDIAILRITSTINYVKNAVAAGSFAGANYDLPFNAVVWAIGWGAVNSSGPGSERLRQVQNWVIPQATCTTKWASYGRKISANMVCAGYLGYGGRDQCLGDAGGPLFHNGIVVGVSSWGPGCGNPNLPSVNTRVAPYISWIVSNV